METENIIKAKNIHDNPVELIFIRLSTEKESAGGIARRIGFSTIPEKSGWEKIYKQYGEQGKGYYYLRTITKGEKP